VDALHPYGNEEVVWGWLLLAPGTALVGMARRSTVERYLQLFTEAGVLVSNFTFPAAALHAAVRLDGIAGRADGFIALGPSAAGAVEAYGESPQRPVFSAEFRLPPERAAALALSELRLPPETVPLPLEEVLPKPEPSPAANELSRNALAYATALAGACPRLAPSANVLPPEQRRFSSRAMFIPTAILGVLLLAALATAAVYSRMAQRDYLARLNAEISRLQPSVGRAAALDRETSHAQARAAWLDGFRARTRQDLDVLNQLTNLIAPPAWTNTVDVTRESTRLQGEAPQAAPLWKIIDGSRLFKASKLDSATPNANGGENFVMTGAREGGK
jgi:Tfp pilus assembly protein PilN